MVGDSTARVFNVRPFHEAGREGETTYASPYCERERQSPEGAQQSELASGVEHPRLRGLTAGRGSAKPKMRLFRLLVDRTERSKQAIEHRVWAYLRVCGG